MKNLAILILLTFSANLFGNIHADFSVDKFSGCSPLLANFTSTSTTSIGTIDYSWDFSNGNGSALPSPAAMFNSPGVYRVKLIVNNGTEKDSVTKSVTVFRLPQVDFTALSTNLCENEILHLTSNIIPGNAPITDYAWGFGNGVASSGTNTNYIYPQSGDYDITLVVQDSNHCSTNLTKQLYVHVSQKPHANFTASPYFSCSATQLINFTNTSTGTGLTCFWILHDTVTSNLANPSYTYHQERTSVTLVVTNSNGCVDSYSDEVAATELMVDFNADKQQACTGEPISFSNNTNFQRISLWSFGDGTVSSDRNPIHIYSTPGMYTVKLIERYGYSDCIDSLTKVAYITITQGFIPSISASNPPAGCYDTINISFVNNTPNAAQFLWNFGDGGTSNLENPNHNYSSNGNYTVVVVITDSNGCSMPVNYVVSINNHKPNTGFSAPTIGCPNLPITFHNTSGAVSAFTYLWNFGDGDTSNLQHPVHNYRNPGTYSVSLTVKNGPGCDSTIIRPNYITIEDIQGDFNVNQKFSPCPPFVALFTSTVNKSGVKYFWNFGDGSTDTAANPTHIYFHPGIFTVKLAVKTINGCIDTVTYPNLIEVQGPVGQFSVTPSVGCSPLSTSFIATVSSNTKTMYCDLGDGGLIIDSIAFCHTYTQVGTFNPKFILEDYVGCSVPYDLPPVVTHANPALQLRDTSVCVGKTVSVSLGSDRYKWTPSTYLSCDTCSSLTIVPSATTSYIVRSTNQYGCVTFDTIKVTAEPLPVLTPSSIKVCKNSSVVLNAGNAFRMSWSPAVYLNDSTAIQPVCTPLDSVIYTATAFNNLGCSVSSQVTVNILDKLDVTAVGDITVCALDTFHLESTVADMPDAGVTYNWTPANYLTDENIADPTAYNLQSQTTFSVIVSAQTCTPDTALVTVHISGLPDVHISESVTTTPYAEVGMWANSHEQLTYMWSAADSFSCVSCRQTNFYPSQTQMVYVTGTNEAGCHASDSVQIKVMACDPESVFMPNVFTPNGDGLNDELFLSSKVLASINYFRVFDEWGRMVYETKNITDTWDGKVNGAPAAVNAFAYVLEGKCQNGGSVLKYGNITLVR